MPKVQKKKVNSLNTKHIVEKVSQRVGFPKNHVKETITELLKVIDEELKEGRSISFIGYFSFSTRKKPAGRMVMRFGKNKGKEVETPAKIIPVLKFSTALKERIKVISKKKARF
jgi:nucleoid DNA-binding protein